MIALQRDGHSVDAAEVIANEVLKGRKYRPSRKRTMNILKGLQWGTLTGTPIATIIAAAL
jgi:hypothetical protein